MKVAPYDNGILVIPDTEFETEYLRTMFTLNQNRRVTFNPDSATLKVVFADEVNTNGKDKS